MNIKTLLIKIFTFLGGLYFFLEFVLPPEFLGFDFEKYHESITVGFITMGAMAVGLGLINLLSLHLNKILLKKKDYFFSVSLLVSLFIMLIVLSLDWFVEEKNVSKAKIFQNLSSFSNTIVEDAKVNKKGVLPQNLRNEKLLESVVISINNIDINQNMKSDITKDLLKTKKNILSTCKKMSENENDLKYNLLLAKRLRNFSVLYKEYLGILNQTSLIKKLYLFCFDGLFNPLVIAMFSLLGFYVATASYRAFKIKSLESFLMMLSALIVILGQIPFGVKLWQGFPSVRIWLLSVPSTGAFRAITLGAFIASLVMALRMWFSLEGHTSNINKTGEKK